MSKLYQFYTDVLSEIDFSIKGYHKIETILNSFFKKICNSNWFIENTNISCISFAYASLEDLLNFKVKSLSSESFFFNSFFEKSFEEFIVSDYGFFRKYLEYLTSYKVKSSETVAELFDKNPTPFKVVVSDTSHCSVEYLQHFDVITFNIPASFYIKNIDKNTNESHIKLAKQKIFQTYEAILENNNNNSNVSLVKKENIYSYNNDVLTNCDVFKIDKDKLNCLSDKLMIYNLINSVKLLEAHKILTLKFKKLNKTNDCYFFTENVNTDTLIGQFINTILSHGLFALIYDIQMENIPSVVYIDNYGSNNETKRSLGTFIVGYKNELSFEDKAKLRILGDKLSSVIAGVVSNLYFSNQLKFLEIKNEVEYRRTTAHYLKPLYFGMSLLAKNLNDCITNSKSEKALKIAKAIEIQTAILTHLSSISQYQTNSDLSKIENYSSNKIKFTTFIKYIYLRGLLIGQYVSDETIENYTESELKVLQLLCENLPINDSDEIEIPLESDLINLYNKSQKTDIFKIIFDNDTENLNIVLYNDKYILSDIILKLTSLFIDNFKKHWIKSKTQDKNKKPHEFTLEFYTEYKNEETKILILQNCDRAGFVDNKINDNINLSSLETFKKELRIGLKDASDLFLKFDVIHNLFNKKFDYKTTTKLSGNKTKENNDTGEFFIQQLIFKQNNKLFTYEQSV